MTATKSTFGRLRGCFNTDCVLIADGRSGIARYGGKENGNSVSYNGRGG